jgi:aminomethyltransferase
MVVNAGNRQKIVRWLRPHLADFPDVAMTDTTEQTAMIAVQGPFAMDICRVLFPTSVQKLGIYRARVTDQMSKPAIVSRTGYTGEDGLEIIVRADDAMRVWENILLAGRARNILPAGLGARDTLRLEAGMPLYGHELSEDIDPFQAGLDFAVQLNDRDFIGRDAIVQRQQASGRRRVGLVLEGKRAARQDAQLFAGDMASGMNGSSPVGIVTSGSFSPTLQKPIAMAYVDPAHTAIGTVLQADIRGSHVHATVTSLPFYRRSLPSAAPAS